MLKVTGLVKDYGEVRAVDGIDLTVESGEFVAVLGSSGCGKTTTLRCIGGLESPDEGEIWIDNRLVWCRASQVPAHRRGIGFIFQSFALWPHMTVLQNVRYGLKRQRLDRATIAERCDRYLSLVGLSALRDRYPGELSGGQAQRVALARAVALEPRLVLFDEPLSNLDEKLRDEMREELRRLVLELKQTAVYVTHDQREALSIADRIVVMDEGRVAQDGSPQELYTDPASRFVAGFIGRTNAIPVQIVSCSSSGVTVEFGTTKLHVPDSACRGQPVVGREAWLAVKREDVQLHGADDVVAEGGVPANVVHVSYHGSDYEVGLAVTGVDIAVRARLEARVADGAAFGLGSSVGLSFRRSSLLCH